MGKKWYAFTFLIFIFLMPVLHAVFKDLEFSELENRNLAKRPVLQVEKALDGSFGKEVEAYLADQFPFRNQFLSLKLYTDFAIGKRESNGVFIGKEGRLLQDFKRPDLELLEKNARYINDFAEEIKTWFLLAPTATSIYKECLPAFASPYDEELYLEQVKEALSEKIAFVDTVGDLKEHKGEPIYYKTDHHWTTLGAFYAYQSLCRKMGIAPQELEDFRIERVSESFYGSLYSQGNITFAKPDTVEVFYPKEADGVQVENMADGTVSDSLYAMEYLDKKDKYSLFLNQNQPLLVIRSLAGNGKKLMMIKDSYANCLIPFLTAHFEEIHVLDLRYLNFSVREYALQNGIEEALLLYNVQNFAGDTRLSLLK